MFSPCPVPSFLKIQPAPIDLIKAGAALITSAEDIFDAFGLPREKENLKLNLALEPNEEKIYYILAEPTDRDELIRKTGLPPAKANSVISMMIINGLIKESGGEVLERKC